MIEVQTITLVLLTISGFLGGAFLTMVGYVTKNSNEQIAIKSQVAEHEKDIALNRNENRQEHQALSQKIDELRADIKAN